MSSLYSNEISEGNKKSFWKSYSPDSASVEDTVRQCFSVGGIPDSCRENAWKSMLDKSIAQIAAEENFGYEELVEKDEAEIKDLMSDIDRDLERIDDEETKTTLRKVLKCLAIHDTKNNYLIGLASIANLVFSYLGETDTYYALILLLKKNYKDYYSLDAKGYCSESRVIKSLLAEKDTKLFNQINAMEVDVNPYFTKFLTSLFIKDISEDLAKLLLDACFCIIAFGSGSVGFEVDTIICSLGVAILRSTCSSFLKKDDPDEAARAFKKDLQKVTNIPCEDLMKETFSIAGSIPDYKIRAFREKHAAQIKSELEERERGLWSDVTITFDEGSLGLSLASSGPYVQISRFKRQDNGLPGVAESSGLLAVGAVLIGINDEEVAAKKKKGSATAAVKAIKAAGRPVNLKFIERSVLEQKAEEAKSKKSAYVSDNYLPNYLLVGEKIMVNVESNYRVCLVKGSFYDQYYEYHKGRLLVTNYRIIFHPYLKLKNGKKSSDATTPRSPRSPTEESEKTPNDDKSPMPIEETDEETIPGPLGTEDWQCPLLTIDQLKEVTSKNSILELKTKQTVHFQFGSSRSANLFNDYINDHAFPGKYDDVFAYRYVTSSPVDP